MVSYPKTTCTIDGPTMIKQVNMIIGKSGDMMQVPLHITLNLPMSLPLYELLDFAIVKYYSLDFKLN